MNLEVKKIRLNALESFVQSEMYRQLLHIPITQARVKSYIHNPHAKPEDVVLYLGFIDEQLVAFRSLFAGTFQTKNKKIHFAWCSGNWVHPNFRRKGFSEKLLTEAFTDWSGKLMFTNYAPNSEKLYLKTGWFQSIYQFDGIRGYLFPKTQKLVQAANKNNSTKFLFLIVDYFITIGSTIQLWFFKARLNPKFKFETIETPDKQCYEFIQNIKTDYPFNRNKKELKWIFRFPWISSNKDAQTNKYPFSSYSNSFSYHTIKIFIEKEFVGFFIFSVREGHLKTLYFNVNRDIEKEIANFLKQFCKKYKIEIITVYNFKVAKQFFERKFPFLRVKKYGQKIYSSFKINGEKEYLFQDGDGDIMFT